MRSLLRNVVAMMGVATFVAACGGDGADRTQAATTAQASGTTRMLELEKDELTLGFIKLTDMAPLAIAYELGYFEDEGLYVTLEPQSNWKVLLDRVITGELDGAHMLAGQPLDLPARERGLLELLIMRAGKVVARESIVQSLTSLEDDLSANAIEQYVSRLRKRLAPAGLTVRTARGIGYFLDRASP